LSTADVTISVRLASTARGGPAPDATLELVPPNGDRYGACPPLVPCAALGSAAFSKPQRLTFTPGTSGALTALVSVYVRAQALGDASNGLNAAAVMPQVFYECSCSGSSIPLLQVRYNLAGAGSYDWSSFPALQAGATGAAWQEPVVADGDTPGRAALGVDDATQQRDNAFLFAAGAFIGTAGAALVAAITEVFRASD
jgi:hypothetical protein